MSSLSKVPVVHEFHPAPEAGANAWALLHEIETHLHSLATQNIEHSIDLQSLPLAPGELEYIRAVLGDGEVSVRIDALGASDVRETAIAGVWWVTHRNETGQRIAEILEISFCPDIVRTHKDEVRAGLDLLTERIAQGLPT